MWFSHIFSWLSIRDFYMFSVILLSNHIYFRDFQFVILTKNHDKVTWFSRYTWFFRASPHDMCLCYSMCDVFVTANMWCVRQHVTCSSTCDVFMTVNMWCVRQRAMCSWHSMSVLVNMSCVCEIQCVMCSWQSTCDVFVNVWCDREIQNVICWWQSICDVFVNVWCVRDIQCSC